MFRWFRAILLNRREMKLVVNDPVIGHVENRSIFQTEVLILLEIGPWGQRPVWSVLTDLYEYVRDRVMIPLKPFFVASHFSSP